MKEVIYIPIIHTEVEMRAVSDSLKMEYLAKYDKEKWQQHTKTIVNMWNGLDKKIFNLNLPYRIVKIYQDGLPVCGREFEIVRDVAKKGNLNHKIILKLIKKGAKLCGTEDSDLLSEEYNCLKKLYQTTNIAEKRKAMTDYRRMAREILIKRDKFIAKRIENTLTEEEIGILFMDIRHTVDKYLKDTKISYLIHILPFKESYEVTMNNSSVQ